MGMPHVKGIAGHTGLWELRIHGERKIFRIFFGHDENRVVLLHAVVKKSERTPAREIDLASDRLRQWKGSEAGK